ncbi:MAG TPA: D-alanyl-D-alanine carboxypeptidase/D-alanyl-D-alanine-endopeptidase [Gaiellaceae bacterium]|nr:D-alanyl-D-alanine carboxypeptidase/D-alanyl-D-alanine-endopeptidase [Gaiellaceae bacterium]
MRRNGVDPRRGLALLAALLAASVAAGPAAGQSLAERLDEALNIAGMPRAKTGAWAFDLAAGRAVYGQNARRSFQPASNQKLAVALAALARLGPGYRIPTEVIPDGTVAGTTLRGRLALKGYGDPTLSRTDLRRFAAAVRAAGIRRITGRIVGDERYYDRLRTGLGWRSSWYKVESPPLSALVVGRARVNGRTVDRPALAAARAFRDALVAAGVSVGGRAATGRAPAGVAPLAVRRSRTMTALVRRMNKPSDNFVAEMLLKHLGARFRDAGTAAAGCAVVRRVLRARSVPLDGVRCADGSGLSPYNRLTARAVGALLLSAWRNAAIRGPFVDSLPIAGVDGTLEDRMRSGPARGRVRAKTGTTSTASALSGYAGTRFVFSVLQNGSPVNWERARRAQNRFAQALARAL